MTSTRSPSRPDRWVITIAATAVSTYALDAVATAAGLLVASQLLRGLDHWLVLLFLAGTYVAWGAGLRVNLQANWALLEGTGTSTNALSKAAYDLGELRTGSAARAADRGRRRLCRHRARQGDAVLRRRVRRRALTDSVSANDALIFLGGANLGAAAYEYGLAGASLRARGRDAAYASFERDWVPREYLADYYSAVEPDERETIAFFVDAMRDVRAR